MSKLEARALCARVMHVVSIEADLRGVEMPVTRGSLDWRKKQRNLISVPTPAMPRWMRLEIASRS